MVDVTYFVESAGRALPELAMKASLVLAAAFVLAFALRRRSASARHLVWVSAIAGVLALPLAQRVPVRVAVLPASLAGSSPEAAANVTESVFPVDKGEHAVSAFAEAAAPEVSSPAPASGAAWAPAGMDRGTVLLVVWMLGAIVLIGRMLVGTGTLLWLARTGTRIDDEEWTSAADRISRAFDGPSARLIRTRWTAMPMTWGIIRPVVLLPADCGEWPAERRDVVLRHELAHVARRDVLTLALAQFACAVHWFNPLAWVALHQLRAEAERCCDDAVLSTGTRASTYAGHLLDMVRLIGRARVPAAVVLPMAQRSTFEGRLLAILEPGIERGAPGRRRIAMIAGGVATLVLALGALRPADAAARLADGQADATVTAAIDGRAAVHGDTRVPSLSRKEMEKLPEQARAAITALVAEPGSAVPQAARGTAVAALTDALADRDATVRLSAIQALGSLEDPRAVQALIQALRTDTDPEVRRMAAWALGNIEDRAAVPALVQAMSSDREVEVRRTATWALGNIADPSAVDGLSRAVRDADAEVSETAVWALGNIEDRRAVPALAAVLRDGDPRARRQAAWALGNLEASEAVQPLVSAMRDGDEQVRATAVWALGNIESAEAVPALTGALRDPNVQTRRQAVWALGNIEAGTAVEALGTVLRTDADATVRETAAWALGSIEAGAALEDLSAALADRSPRVRAKAAWAIGTIEPGQAPQALVAALRDEDRQVRMAAGWAVGQTGDTSALEPLLRDPDAEVRTAAARALGGGPDPRPDPRPQPRPQPRPRPIP